MYKGYLKASNFCIFGGRKYTESVEIHHLGQDTCNLSFIIIEFFFVLNTEYSVSEAFHVQHVYRYTPG